MKIQLHYILQLQGTLQQNRIPLSCTCRSQCSNKRCVCYKNKRSCSIYCHKDDYECSNMAALLVRTEVAYIERQQEQEQEQDRCLHMRRSSRQIVSKQNKR